MTRPAPWLCTERLALRRFGPEDLDHLAALYAEPEVARYVGGPRNRAEAALMLQQRMLEYYERHPGLGIWLTEERGSGAAVGLHLLNHIQGEPDIQLGYLLLPAYWGLGYATEGGAALLRHGFEDMALQRIVAITHLDNLASQRVLLKLGLVRHGERVLAHPAYASQGPLAWFELGREDYAARAPREGQ